MGKNETKEVKVKTGLSTGVKVGIGIGIGCLVVIIVIIVFVAGCSKVVNDAAKQTINSQSASPTQESRKTYQEVFRFEGKDAKKSESFSINGSQFKIKYECKGSLCQAWVKKSEPQSDIDKYYSQLIMNSAGDSSSETYFYDGAGKYYIDCNSLGTYTMVVEDYK